MHHLDFSTSFICICMEMFSEAVAERSHYNPLSVVTNNYGYSQVTQNIASSTESLTFREIPWVFLRLAQTSCDTIIIMLNNNSMLICTDLD